MEAVAAEAGVGKGTLFRAFGSRDGLLDALWATKLSSLRESVENGAAPLGPAAPAHERAAAFLDALLDFKLNSRGLIRARERSSTDLWESAQYRWMHGHLAGLLADAAPRATAGDPGYAAHALLSALHVDLLEQLLAEGRTAEEIRRAQIGHLRAVLNDGDGDRNGVARAASAGASRPAVEQDRPRPAQRRERDGPP
jgi:AcrR family transcriptional regulator